MVNKLKRIKFCQHPNLAAGHDVRSASPNDSLPRRLQIAPLPKIFGAVLAVTMFAAVLAVTASRAQTPAALLYDSKAGPISFGAGDLNTALTANGFVVTVLPLGDPESAKPSVRFILTTEDAKLPGQPVTKGVLREGYSIQSVTIATATNWWVIGKDAAGAMYGALEVAESVQLAHGLGGVTNRQTNPYLDKRGIKFNIPLDARSPSYSDDSDSAQANIGNMWETNFWAGMLDNMARHRMNLLSLWSLHPFPSMVRVPEYPNVALADVKRKAGPMWNATLYGTKMFDPSWELTTLKKMTIEEKIAFWRWVMQYAKDRGIEFYVMTWNIFVHGAESSGYGITESPTNAITKDYFRKSVRALCNTYPLLGGVGLTTGENMGEIDKDGAAKEQWAWDTYGLGVSDAMADAKNPASPFYAPDRKTTLIHRAHMADLKEIINVFSALPGRTNADSSLVFSFKYSQAHMLSSTKPLLIHRNNWFKTIPAGSKTLLTVRNDDMYYMRWGDPDFARAYLSNLPDLSKIAGIYIGPDGYTWGREYLSTEPDSPRQLVIEKMWYFFLLYGRLAYDPTIPNSRFEAIVGEKFPTVPAEKLFQGWASASKIFPLIARFYWGALDFQWYPEACWSADGFESVQKFIKPRWKPMPANEDGDRPLLMSVKEFVDGAKPDGRLTPEQVADQLQQLAERGLANIAGLDAGTNKELRLTLGDINAMAALGNYYAEKIRGAVALYRYETKDNTADHALARKHLISASNHWKQYAAQWSSQYVKQVLTRMGLTVVDIAGIQAQVDADIPPEFTTTNRAAKSP